MKKINEMLYIDMNTIIERTDRSFNKRFCMNNSNEYKELLYETMFNFFTENNMKAFNRDGEFVGSIKSKRIMAACDKYVDDKIEEELFFQDL